MEFSRPFSLTRYAPARWVIAESDLHWLMDALDDSPHVPVAPPQAMRARRRSAKIELRAQDVVEWPDPRKPKRQRKASTARLPAPQTPAIKPNIRERRQKA